MIDPKPRPNHARYLATLRRMSPSARLAKALELSADTRRVFAQGLAARFPSLGDDALHRLLLDRLAKCHNSTS